MARVLIVHRAFFLLPVTAALVAGCSLPGARPGILLTLGIHVNCPYGLAG